jgi:hypothetical protein
MAILDCNSAIELYGEGKFYAKVRFDIRFTLLIEDVQCFLFVLFFACLVCVSLTH